MVLYLIYTDRGLGIEDQGYRKADKAKFNSNCSKKSELQPTKSTSVKKFNTPQGMFLEWV